MSIEKRKFSTGSQPLTQSYLGGQVISNFRFVLLFMVLGSLLLFYTASRPMAEDIQRMFSLKLPATSYNINLFNEIHDETLRLASFSIKDNDTDLSLVLDSLYEDEAGECLIDALEYDYMPDFVVTERYDWWQPHKAKYFEGAWCYLEFDSGRSSHDYLLIDYSIDGQITFYFQHFTIAADGYRTQLD
jgi:hypothetical protein